MKKKETTFQQLSWKKVWIGFNLENHWIFVSCLSFINLETSLKRTSMLAWYILSAVMSWLTQSRFYPKLQEGIWKSIQLHNDALQVTTPCINQCVYVALSCLTTTHILNTSHPQVQLSCCHIILIWCTCSRYTFLSLDPLCLSMIHLRLW